MPKISPTEAAALNAGTVGFDGDLFSGTPSLKNLVDNYDIKLSVDEQEFMVCEVVMSSVVKVITRTTKWKPYAL